MAKEKPRFEDFLLTVDPANLDFVTAMHDSLLQNGCTVKLESAKSGYVVSYGFGATGKVLANYVMRKQGLMIRIYADFVAEYADFLETLPAAMQAKIQKASICRRLADPAKCNSRCAMGYVFPLNGQEYKNCRFSAFMFFLTPEGNPYIRDFLDKEIRQRALALA